MAEKKGIEPLGLFRARPLSRMADEVRIELTVLLRARMFSKHVRLTNIRLSSRVSYGLNPLF